MKIVSKLIQAVKDAVIVCGTKGCAIAPFFPKTRKLDEPFTPDTHTYESMGISALAPCAAVALGKSAVSIHASLAAVDEQWHVSRRGQPVIAHRLSDALKKGIVKQVSLIATKDNQAYPFTGYVLPSWKPGMEFTKDTGAQYIGTLDRLPGNCSGRVEAKPISDGRAKMLYFKISEPKAAAKPAKATGKPAVKPTTGKATTGKASKKTAPVTK